MLDSLLGLHAQPEKLTTLQVALRAIIVFILALVMVRLGDKRFLSRKTAFDAILGFILASMLARAVNGSAAFGPTLVAGFVLIALHRIIAFSSRRWHLFGKLAKGTSDPVIQDGKIVETNMRRNDMSERDLLEDLRLNGGLENPEDVKIAHIERNGDISVVRKKDP